MNSKSEIDISKIAKDWGLDVSVGDSESYTPNSKYFKKFQDCPTYYFNFMRMNYQNGSKKGYHDGMNFRDAFLSLHQELLGEKRSFRHYIYIHNFLVWDSIFIESSLSKEFLDYKNVKKRTAENEDKKCWSIFKRDTNKNFKIEIWGKNGDYKFHYIFLCSYALLSSSLEKLALPLGLTKFLEDENGKIYKPDFDKIPIFKNIEEFKNYERGKLFRYAKNDCYLLREILKNYRDQIRFLFPKITYEKIFWKAKQKYIFIPVVSENEFVDNAITYFLTAAALAYFAARYQNNISRIKNKLKLEAKFCFEEWRDDWKEISKNDKKTFRYYWGGLNIYAPKIRDEKVKREGEEFRHRGNFKIYDINSSYPFSMINYLPYGSPMTDPKTEDENYFSHKNYLVLHHIKIIKATKKESYFPNLIRNINGGLFKENIENIFVVWGDDYLKIMLNFYDIEYEIQKTRYYRQNKFLSDHILSLYNLRLANKLTNPALAELCKLLMNSLYGKFGENPDKEDIMVFYGPEKSDLIGESLDKNYEFCDDENEKYRVTIHQKLVSENHRSSGVTYIAELENLKPKKRHKATVVAGRITELSRIALLKAVWLNRKNFLYGDTDSIIIAGDIITRDENYEIFLDTKELGSWKFESEGDEFIFVKNKKYDLRKNGISVKKATSGIRKDTDFDEFILTGFAEKNHLIYTKNGVGIAIKKVENK